jgi:hypothetical protein
VTWPGALRRIFGALAFGTAIGLGLSSLPDGWQPWIILVVCAGTLIWCVSSIRWARRQQREIGASFERLERLLERERDGR